MLENDPIHEPHNSFIRKIEKSSSESFLTRLMRIIVSIILLYIPIFWFANAKLTSASFAIAVASIFPILHLLQERDQSKWAKIGLVSSCNFFVILASITTNHTIHVEYYCLATMLLGFILFDQESIFWTCISILKAFMTWTVISFHNFLLPFKLEIPSSMPTEALEKINFFGSFAISAVFLVLFSKHNKEKRLKTLRNERESHEETQKALISKMKAEFQYRKLFEAMKEGVIVYDKNRRIVQCNQSARNILELSQDEANDGEIENIIFGSSATNRSTDTDREHPLDLTLRRSETYKDSMRKIRLKSGAVHWISLNSRPYLHSSQDHPGQDEIHALVTISDVTDKISMQIELEEFFELSLDLMCVLDLDGKIRRSNPSLSHILKTSKKELYEIPWIDWVDGKDRDLLLKSIKSLDENNRYIRLDCKMVTKEGERRTLEWVFHISPETQSIYASGRDKTEELRAQDNFKQIIAALNTTSIVASFDKSGKIVEANDAFCKLTAYSRNEVIGQNIERINEITIPELSAKSLRIRIKKDQTWTGEIAGINRQGEHYWLQSLVFPLKSQPGSAVAFMAISFDVSLSKLREKEREKLSLQLEEAQRVARIGSWALDLRTGAVHSSKQMYVLFGRDPNESSPNLDYYIDNIHPDDRAILLTKLNESSQTGERYKVRFRTHNTKKVLWLESIGQGSYDGEGRLIGLSGTCQDISEKVESEERLGSILDALHIGVWTFEPESKRLEWDDRMHRLYGIEVDPNLGLFESRQQSLSISSRAESKMAIHLAAAGKKDFDTLLQVTDRSGQLRYIAEQGIALFNQEGNQTKLTGISWDRTKEIQMDQSLAEQRARTLNASKMASLGEMSAGIAHEINNPLAIIVFKVQKIHKNVVEKNLDETKVLQDLKDIKDTALRISTIVKGLKAFSRNSENDPFERVKVRSVIEDSLVLCKERFKNGNVNLIVGEIPDLSFNGRASQISQILINILNNAYDAVRESVTPWIKIDVKETDKGLIHFVITDSGPGIDPDTAEKMMEPFFTTKPLGLGTGLGLSISLAMAKDHGGSIFLDQSSDNTSFVVEIPILNGEETDNDHE